MRLLAKYGFVELAEARGDARDRPWRLVDIRQQWSGEDAAADQLERVFVQREADRILAWSAASRGEREPWRSADFVGGASLPLTADELASVRAQLEAVIQPYVARLTDRTGWPEGTRFVRILLAGTPSTENVHPTEETSA